MGCDICKFYKKKNFRSEDDFIKFKRELNMLIDQGKMEKIKDLDSDSYFYSSEYKCNECNQHWKLVEPDQAFRGNWEPL